jgi:hypothetical protein
MKETLNIIELVDALEKKADKQTAKCDAMRNESEATHLHDILTTQGKEIGIRLAIREIFRLAKQSADDVMNA